MQPTEALNKLRRLRDWNKMTDAKREALNVAIKAVEAHEVAIEIFEEGKGTQDYHCPVCHSQIGCMCYPVGGYCRRCGQKLKAPEE